MSILITGFEPFGGETVNPSWLAVSRQQETVIGGQRIVCACLPTAFNLAADILQDLIDNQRPQLVIAVGQATGRSAISVERVAINIDDARIPDNLGAQPIDRAIIDNGPPAYFSTLPIKAIVQSLNNSGIAAEVSNSAGTFVCNHLFYHLMHISRRFPGMRAGFVHIPCLPEQAQSRPGTPSMPLDTISQAMALIVETAWHTTDDLQITAGREC